MVPLVCCNLRACLESGRFGKRFVPLSLSKQHLGFDFLQLRICTHGRVMERLVTLRFDFLQLGTRNSSDTMGL